jgi:serine/threonine protein kinase
MENNNIKNNSATNNNLEMGIVEVHLLFNNNYLVLNKIGEGGFGIVWRAFDLSLKNFVAIKRLNRELTHNVKFVEMFYNEAVIARSLVHDNIVRTHHFWRDDKGDYYILMDYVKGNSLSHLIKKCKEQNKKISWQQAVFIVAGICKVLDYLHRLAKQPLTGKPYNIIFMDLTPSNIMVSFDGDVKITDFGIAKTNRETHAIEKTAVIAGKYNYMSPEQIMADPNIDFRTDIFSAGLILYELLTGENNESKPVSEIKDIILNTKFDFSKIDPEVPQELVEIVSKSLKKNKEDRYSSALEMYRDLRALLVPKTTEELKEEFAKLVSEVLVTELDRERKTEEFVQKLDVSKLMENRNVTKIKCYDFIPGSTVGPPLPQVENTVSTTQTSIPTPVPHLEPSSSNVEEKGKTVFEEVGNWIIQQIKLYRKRITLIFTSFLIAGLIFVAIDTFLPGNITPLGRKIYGRIFPPDVVITLTPPSGRVTITSKDGKPILSDAYVTEQLEVRRLVPGSYEVVAVREGLKPIQQVITVDAYSKSKTQQINLVFTLSLAINSLPQGADVYINGTKVGTTPWAGEVLAQKIAVQLDFPGFEKLGSVGKEQKEGYCFLDFTQTSEQLMFANIDNKYWSYSSSYNVVGQYKTYNLFGKMYKKISFDSFPKELLIFVDDLPSAAGMTPTTLNLTSGFHTLKFTGNPQYQELVKPLEINQTTPQEIFVNPNKWITIYAYEKDTSKFINANFYLESGDTKFSGVTTPQNPARLALPVKTYNVRFDAGKNYKPLWFTVDIKEVNKIAGYLELRNPKIKFYVISSSSIPVKGAFIWIDNKVVGKTDDKGIFETELTPGEKTIKIVTDKFKPYSETKTFYPAKDENLTFVLELNTIKCPTCGKEYPGDTKLKFCTNCGTQLPK